MLIELYAICKQIGLNINFRKTHFMKNMVPNENLTVDGNAIALIHKYECLGNENHNWQ